MVVLQVIGGALFILMSAFFLWIISKIARLEKKSFGMALRTAALVGIITMALNQILKGALNSVIFAVTLMLSMILVKKFHEATWLKSVIVACAWTLVTTGTVMGLAYLIGLILMGAGFQTIAAVG